MTADADGTFTVRISASDIGTGARTALTLIAADALRVPAERVRVHLGDSDFGPSGIAARLHGHALLGLGGRRGRRGTARTSRAGR